MARMGIPSKWVMDRFRLPRGWSARRLERVGEEEGILLISVISQALKPD